MSKKISYKSEEGIGHVEVPDDAIIYQEGESPTEPEPMLPGGMEFKETDKGIQEEVLKRESANDGEDIDILLPTGMKFKEENK